MTQRHFFNSEAVGGTSRELDAFLLKKISNSVLVRRDLRGGTEDAYGGFHSNHRSEIPPSLLGKLTVVKITFRPPAVSEFRLLPTGIEGHGRCATREARREMNQMLFSTTRILEVRGASRCATVTQGTTSGSKRRINLSRAAGEERLRRRRRRKAMAVRTGCEPRCR